MKQRRDRRGWMAGLAWGAAGWMAAHGAEPATPAFHAWAATPPMGWNSYDSWGCVVTEAEVKANADYMAAKLAKFGWQYVVIDIQWYEATATDMYCPQKPVILMDAHGRPQPVPRKFPSAADGRGFKPLADYVHGKGLKFGLHIMRGIPRAAVEQNLLIQGSTFTAADAADRTRPCGWCPDMWGVDAGKPAGQAWYDALYAQFAAWGVDYVKCDDLSSPYHADELEAIRRAIDKTGRPIVLSTSPGATPLDHGPHVRQQANLWRISGDFWDNWRSLKEMFELCHRWTPFRGPGHWPDADMLPIGYLRMWDGKGEPTKFTPEEQYTMMSLWCMARSPLMIGGQMPKNDAFTEALLTNPEVLAVNQTSANNRQLWRRDPFVAWVADVPGSRDKYLALFNARDRTTFGAPLWSSARVTPETPGRAVDVEVDVTSSRRLYLVVEEGGDGYGYDHVNWIEPRVETDGGEVRLTDLAWVSATSGWGEARVNRAVGGGDLKVNGASVPYGIGTHSPSVIVYDLPAGARRFKARAGLDDGGVGQGRGGATVRFVVYDTQLNADGAVKGLPVPVTWAELGLPETVRVRDLWGRRDLGPVKETFAPLIPWHGAGLYRLSP